jgi:AcrR family transcriptional regulator
MKNTTRMGLEERKKQILKAVQRVFARKGFEGATSRELAQEAGISEALMFRHFPSKEALYRAVIDDAAAPYAEELERLASLEPSSSSLIHVVHFLTSLLLRVSKNPERENIMRLSARSLTEDGAFARTMHVECVNKTLDMIESSIKAAIASGDIVDSPVAPRRRAFFADRLPFIVMLNFLPTKPVADLGTQSKLVADVVWFILRGIGLKEEVIKRIYNPKALALAS